jgi:Domain of unknown function (DUF6285)
MHNSPSIRELIEGVIDFLNQVATPGLSGHAQFHARVSANALALVARELAAKDTDDANAVALYRALLASDDHDIASLEAQICARIEEGTFDTQTPNLLSSLRAIATAQLEVDQPNYSGLSL